MPLETQEVHRHGPLKQSNKAHKGEKGKRKKQSKGRSDVKTLSRKKRDVKRVERKNQMNQRRKAKKEKVLEQKRNHGGLKSLPILVMILSLDDSISPTEFLDKLESCDEDLITTQSPLGHRYISCFSVKKRYTFLIPNKTDLHSILDALKVCETLLLLHSPNAHDDNTKRLLSVMMAQALPTTVHVVQGFDKMNPKKKAVCRKRIHKAIESRFPDAKLQQADTNQELLLLLRQIGNQRQQPIGFRDNRPHLLVENVSFNLKDTVSNKGILRVSGYIRGQPLNVNGLVHIPGWDTFQMNRIQTREFHCDEEYNMTYGPIVTANPIDQESLQSEVIPDPLDQEQTWPTQEELDAADQLKPKKAVRKVIEGTSDYQATWIVDDESEGSEISDEESEESCDDSQMMSDNESEEMEETMDVTDSVTDDIKDDNYVDIKDDNYDDIKDDNYDDNLDMDEEKQMLVRFKEERMNIVFPDEQDTPMDVKAYIRYQKYRGLKNFKSSPWDPMENLPPDYARIYRFENFKQTKKKVLKSEKEGVEPSEEVYVYINDVPQSLYDTVKTENPILTVYGLLPHEQKMSVVNAVIRKHPSCKVPIKSKDTLIFHIGFRRFTCKPIFSEHKTGIKYKYERFLPSDAAVVASFYAPVTFPPVSVVVFRQTQDGSHQLVATGSVLNVDPNRVVVKRIVLSGHPFKINKRSAVVRYMFFNRDDINYFKCIELQTKLGRRGHIKEPLGSHGHMKCVFDKQLDSQDVVLMFLYKRVYPKWTFNNYVPTPVIEELSA